MTKSQNLTALDLFEKELLAKAQVLYYRAILSHDRKILRAGFRLSSGLMRLRSLFVPFQKAHSVIRVAKALGITRNGVYLRLKSLSLTAYDFQAAESMESLFLKSKPLSFALRKVEDLLRNGSQRIP